MIVIIFLINGTITNDELRMPLSVIHSERSEGSRTERKDSSLTL